mmetsp:Transcript_11850/g.32729  ORF Transcript_11850/g.32729 Transcript_11850/m.32729 type:complete len:359 (-) Transcript_11850:668-1744(-)
MERGLEHVFDGFPQQLKPARDRAEAGDELQRQQKQPHYRSHQADESQQGHRQVDHCPPEAAVVALLSVLARVFGDFDHTLLGCRHPGLDLFHPWQPPLHGGRQGSRGALHVHDRILSLCPPCGLTQELDATFIVSRVVRSGTGLATAIITVSGKNTHVVVVPERGTAAELCDATLPELQVVKRLECQGKALAHLLLPQSVKLPLWAKAVAITLAVFENLSRIVGQGGDEPVAGLLLDCDCDGDRLCVAQRNLTEQMEACLGAIANPRVWIDVLQLGCLGQISRVNEQSRRLPQQRKGKPQKYFDARVPRVPRVRDTRSVGPGRQAHLKQGGGEYHLASIKGVVNRLEVTALALGPSKV